MRGGQLAERLEYSAGMTDAGQRLDLFLAGAGSGLSRSRAQKLISLGEVQVNGLPCADKNYRLQAGDTVALHLPEPRPLRPLPEPLSLDIVYEDDDLLVINKPRGMVVHPAPGHDSGTLVNALLYHCESLSTAGGPDRPGIVHRLDKDTTGLLLAAKNDFSHASLAAQLRARTVRREYIVLVFGRVSPPEGKIEAPVGRHPRHRRRMAVVPGGREAVSRYRVIAILGPFSLLQVRLETGRTHQVRVHLNFIKHPVAGDPLYGPGCTPDLPPSLRNGQALHARRISFIHPRSGGRLDFSAPLPPDFRAGLRLLRERYRYG
ncbi:MAG TPA: RluA family pseudouridine synthase [Bacillota bacterium]|nr:RluA family pseudouridine synthase [Bacillota bacterium]HOL15723.1 RluA family pseudouridine synthase [Bacillota bacterium]